MSVTGDRLTNKRTGLRVPHKTQVHGMLLGRGRAIPGTVDGTVIVMSVIVAAARDTADWELVAIVASTAAVIWISHVYAYGLGESIARERRLSWPDVRETTIKQASILAAALLPTLALSLAALDALHQQAAVWLALAIGWATLLIEGVRYARIEHMGSLGTTLAIGVNLALGAIVVSLKVIIG